MIRRATSGARARTCAARASALWASTEGAATSAASPASSSNATATASSAAFADAPDWFDSATARRRSKKSGSRSGHSRLATSACALASLETARGVSPRAGGTRHAKTAPERRRRSASGRTCHRRSNADSTAELRSHCRGAAAPISSTPPSRMGDEVGVKRVSRAQRQASGRSRRATSSASSERRSSEDVEGERKAANTAATRGRGGRATAGEDAIAKGAGHHPARLRRWEAGGTVVHPYVIDGLLRRARESLPRIMRRM